MPLITAVEADVWAVQGVIVVSRVIVVPLSKSLGQDLNKLVDIGSLLNLLEVLTGSQSPARRGFGGQIINNMTGHLKCNSSFGLSAKVGVQAVNSESVHPGNNILKVVFRSSRR